MPVRTNLFWASGALIILGVACSDAGDDTASGGTSMTSSSAGGAGGARAASATVGDLKCDGGAGPTGDLTDIHLIVDQKPFVCEGACQTIFYGDIDVDCDADWRLHARVPAALGTYAFGAGAMSAWVVSGVDPQNPAACQQHPIDSGDIEITSVSDVEVTGVISGVSIATAPGVDPNGPFSAPRCD